MPAAASFSLDALAPAWLTGPIFDKELRVASRRKRYYWLRGAFILLLLLFIWWAWSTETSFGSGSAAYVSARMSTVSRAVVNAVVWLEFITLPLLAALIMSNSISQEINRRTLDVLLTTPITALQLAMGKLLSCLLQLAILVGITLPLLAIIRVFGGVPWDYTCASLSVTAATIGFYTTLSLFYSTQTRHSYKALMWTVLTGLLLFALIPILLSAAEHYFNRPRLAPANAVLEIINPYVTIAELTDSMMNSNPLGTAAVPWLRHCLIMSASIGFLMLLSLRRLRKTMLSFASLDLPQGLFARLTGRHGKTRSQAVAKRAILEIKGDPIVWKDVHRGEPGSLFSTRTQTVLFLFLVAAVYIGAGVAGVLTERAFHAALVTILAALGFLRTAMLSATSISGEKQARTWPILLTIPFDDSRIVNAKIKAILHRTALYWMIIAADVLVFTTVTVLHPLSLIGVAIAVAPTVILLLGVGLYFGMRLKTATGAIAATFAIILAIWFMCPCISSFGPLPMIAMTVGTDNESMLVFLGIGAIPALIYGIAGLTFLSSTKSSMRRYAFNLSG